jgi:hypothetical protein
LGLALRFNAETVALYFHRASELRSVAQRTERSRALLVKAAFDYDSMAMLVQAIENAKHRPLILDTR